MNSFPAKGLKVIGVTGTNGKTTTSFMIHKMLVEAGYKAGLMTTVAYGVGNDIKPQAVHMTSLPVPLFLKRLKQMRTQGMEWLVLETTSHALAQYRVWGIPYSIAVMTNLTHEHLDYHGTFENYRAAKVKLFKMTAKNRKGLRLGIVNADDPSAEHFASAVPNVTTYGLKNGDLKAMDVKSMPSGSEFSVEAGDQKLNIKVNLPGTFNVYNALASVGVGLALGMTSEQIEKGIAALQGVEGRMMRVDAGQKFDVIVDYAHTPDSFEKIFSELKPAGKGRVISVFGSAGRRDEAKRPVQGEIAGKYSDIVIITEEDDRDLDGEAIMHEIAAGAKKAGKVEGKDLFLIHKREDAVAEAIGMARAGDLVILLGKGHEDNILGNGPQAAEFRHLKQDDTDKRRVVARPYDEVAVARKAIKTLK
jgi:UDP-N-acetylmuramoyl-L-alanyl-D-glutamate--2,6-diaminopimelate ligase